MSKYLFFMLLFFGIINSEEFLYPVASFNNDGQNFIYVIYQKNVHHLELWSVNSETMIATKLLMSNFSPAGVRLLPNQAGFSFIDNGRIRVKYTNKRSPLSFDFEYPIYDFHTIDWLNDRNFYFSAKAGKRFCIFLCDTNRKQTKTLIENEVCSRINEDFMYPQIIGGTLYFITKSVHKLSDVQYETFDNYKIMCCNFDIESHKAEDKPTVILRRGENAIAFLKMVSQDEGYFIGHPNKVSKHTHYIHLKYFHLKKIDENWEYSKLFDFDVPLRFLQENSDTRVYESILPFLPVHYENSIYFASYNTENLTEIFCYNQIDSTLARLTTTSWPNSNFGIIISSGQLFFGGNITENCKLLENEDGSISCKIACIPILQ